MAYSFSHTTSVRAVGHRRVYTYVVTELAVALATDEWNIADMPSDGVVRYSKTTFSAGVGGTATTCQPRIGEAAGGSDVQSAAAPAASVRDATDRRFKAITANTLYGSSRLDGTTAGAGSVTTRLVVTDGAY